MMKPNEFDIAKTHQEDLKREAEKHNTAQQMRRRQSKSSLYASVMAQVGGKMVVIGEALQARYDEAHHAEI